MSKERLVGVVHVDLPKARAVEEWLLTGKERGQRAGDGQSERTFLSERSDGLKAEVETKGLSEVQTNKKKRGSFRGRLSLASCRRSCSPCYP